MGLIDKYIKKIIELTVGLKETDIYNIYQMKGAVPQRLVVNYRGKKELVPYLQKDMFVVFGVEEGEDGKETGVITDEFGAPSNTIVVLNRYTIKILFNGDDSDFYALKFKGKLYSKSVQKYLEDNNITVLTQNPKISFETEEVAGEFWDRRGITFNVEIELQFKEDEDPITETSPLIIKILNRKEKNNGN